MIAGKWCEERERVGMNSNVLKNDAECSLNFSWEANKIVPAKHLIKWSTLDKSSELHFSKLYFEAQSRTWGR